MNINVERIILRTGLIHTSTKYNINIYGRGFAYHGNPYQYILG